MIRTRLALAALLLIVLAGPAAGQGASRTYAVDGDCGGRPRTRSRGCSPSARPTP